MEENSKIMSVEDSFDSSDCSIESNFVKWYDEERERLALKGKDISKFCAFADPDINEGSACCEDYAFAFNRDEGVIDLIVNGEKDSPIWEEVIDIVKVPARFAAFLGNPENFLYRISTSTSEEKEFYHFESTDDESGYLSPITKFNAIEDWKAENFDTLI